MTQEVIEKFNQKISNLKEEVNILRSFVIGTLARDREGNYKPKFIKKILKLSKKRADFAFKDAENFLRQIQKSS